MLKKGLIFWQLNSPSIWLSLKQCLLQRRKRGLLEEMNTMFYLFSVQLTSQWFIARVTAELYGI